MRPEWLCVCMCVTVLAVWERDWNRVKKAVGVMTVAQLVATAIIAPSRISMPTAASPAGEDATFFAFLA